MQLTIYTFLMAVIWSSVLIVVLYIGRKKKNFLQLYGVSGITLLYLFCALRMFFAIEFPFTLPIAAPLFYNPLRTFLYSDPLNGPQNITVFTILIVFWVSVSVILIARHIFIYTKSARKFSFIKEVKEKQIEQILNDIRKQDTKRKMNLRVIRSDLIRTPVSIGIINKQIILPKIDYSREDLFHILFHEYSHLRNGDLLVKLLSHIFCYIFWWNPVSYLLLKDLEQSLELKCDMNVTKNMNLTEKGEYMTTILKEVKRSKASSVFDVKLKEALGFTGTKKDALLKERFHAVMMNKKIHSPRQKFYSIIIIVAIMMLSYSFVFQSSFEAPIEEIETTENTYEIEEDEIAILEKVDGTYEYISPYGIQEIDEELAKAMIDEGVQMEKEIER